jgi:fructose-1,6-bisphosphatase I
MNDITLTQYLAEGQREHPEATGEFTDLLNRIALCGKLIGRDLRRSTLTGETGYATTSNVYGEKQEKLDVIANEVFLRHLRYGSIFTLAASEEMAEPATFTSTRETGHYSICFDPIDGSSNLDVNGTLGTIFGIRPRVSSDVDADLKTSGRQQVAAGYLLYGPATELVFTTGHGVAIFTLDMETGEFFLSHDRVKIPKKGRGFAVNEGNSHFWKEGTRRFVEYLKAPDEKTGRPYSTRYSGSLVGDFHRILFKGGIYLYPEDAADPDKPHGKLRVLYECHPMALLAEQAGGRASTGSRPVLDVVPEDLHDRSPLAIGSAEDVELYEKFMAGKGPA